MPGETLFCNSCMSVEGIHDVYLAEGSVDGDKFEYFVKECLLPVLMNFNGINPRSVAQHQECYYWKHSL